MFLGTHLPRIDRFGPEQLRLIPHFDKLVHAGMFGGWFAMCWWILSGRSGRVSNAAMAWLFAAGAAYGAFDEITQGYVGRDTSLGDFVADLCGMLLAMAIIRLTQRSRATGRPH